MKHPHLNDDHEIFRKAFRQFMKKMGSRTVGINLHNNSVVPCIVAYGTEEQKRRYLPKCASGEIITAIAMTEPGAGSDLVGISTTAILQGDYYVVNGPKTFIIKSRTAFGKSNEVMKVIIAKRLGL